MPDRKAIFAKRYQWAYAITSTGAVDSTLLRETVLDRVIEWRTTDPRFAGHQNHEKGPIAMSQRQWTIEARADFADPDKNETISEAVRRAAVHVHATLALLSDGVKPQVVAFSDDFFTGHQEIGLLKDTIGEGIKAQQLLEAEPDPEESVSAEMQAAVREMQRPVTAK